MKSPQQIAHMLKEKAHQLGFLYCGVSKATFLKEEAPKLEEWLNSQKNAKMHWMENYFDKRLDPRLLVEGAKSVITVLLNYFPPKDFGLEKSRNYKISKYAYGMDYHIVIKQKLTTLKAYLESEIGDFNGRAFVDSAPVMDKAWAQKCGAGWIGKNTNLIKPQVGSFFFIGELIVDLEIEADTPIKDYCGTCTKCIDACPTNALDTPYVLDANKCISYLTIELKEDIPSEFKGKMDDWIFGCDICQDVCPWNSFSVAHNHQEFEANELIKHYNLMDWEEITEEIFNKHFKKSAIKRTKWQGLKRNINFVKQS
jgi:epoxyqueuosine reductase